MKTEKQSENLEKQGRGLTVFLKILGVILLLLNLILLDQEFVPWGKTWEEMKADRPEDTAGMSDKELWTLVKDMAIEEEILPFKSGFLCWGVCLYRWNEQKAKEAEREELLRQAEENSKTIMTTLNELVINDGISTDRLGVIEISLRGSRVSVNSYIILVTEQHVIGQPAFDALFTEEEENALVERLGEAFAQNKEEAAARAYILGDKCTAAAFVFRAVNIEEGTDFPYVDENGHFDTERLWGYGWSQSHQAGWLIGYVDETMLAESGEPNETNQE